MTKLEMKEVKTAKGDAVQFIVYIDNRAVSIVIERAVLESMNALTFCKEVLQPSFLKATEIYTGS